MELLAADKEELWQAARAGDTALLSTLLDKLALKRAARPGQSLQQVPLRVLMDRAGEGQVRCYNMLCRQPAFRWRRLKKRGRSAGLVARGR